MVAYSTKRSWKDFLSFLLISIPILLTGWFLGFAGSSRAGIVTFLLIVAFLVLLFILQEIYWKKSYRLELENGLIRETYGKSIKEIKFKSLDYLDGTQTDLPVGFGPAVRYYVYPEFHLTLDNGSKEVFSARSIARLSNVVKAVKEVYPETKISKFIEESTISRFVNNR